MLKSCLDKLKQMVSDVQLSRQTVVHRISQSQRQASVGNICTVAKDCVIKEEVLDIVPLKDRTRGKDLKETTTAAFVKANLPRS